MVDSISTVMNYAVTLIGPQNPLGFIGLFFLTALTDIGIPVPFVLDTLLVWTVYRSGPFSIPVLLFIITLWAGRQLGSSGLFFLAAKLENRLTDWLSRLIPGLAGHLKTIKQKLAHREVLVVITGRLTPGLAQITSISVGSLRLRYSRFVIGVTISSLIYDGVLVLLGFIAIRFPDSTTFNLKIWLLISMIAVVSILWPLVFTLFRNSEKSVRSN